MLARRANSSVSRNGAVRPVTRVAALPQWVRELMDFNSWAPKSSRIWRLQHYEHPTSEADDVDRLEAELNRRNPGTSNSLTGQSSNQATTNAPPTAGLEPPATPAGPASGTSRSTSTGADLASALDVGDLPASGSFSSADDTELSRALMARLQSLSGSGDAEDERSASPAGSISDTDASWAAGSSQEGSWSEDEGLQDSSELGQAPVQPLTGPEMRQLLLIKYGKSYDMSFVRRDIPGKCFVSLNIMWQHLEQRSFRMTEAQYVEKIDSVAYLVNVLEQTALVRSFLQKPAKSEKGLPKRPVVGTAISIRLDVSPAMISEFFGAGYQ